MKYENPNKEKGKLEALQELLIDKKVFTKKELKDKEKEKRK